MRTQFLWSFLLNSFIVKPYLEPIYKAVREEQKDIYREYFSGQKKSSRLAEDNSQPLLH